MNIRKPNESKKLGYFAGLKYMYDLWRVNEGPDATFNKYGGPLSYRVRMSNEQSGRRKLSTSGGRFYSIEIVFKNVLKSWN